MCPDRQRDAEQGGDNEPIDAAPTRHFGAS
jgi:hypothetical protein